MVILADLRAMPMIETLEPRLLLAGNDPADLIFSQPLAAATDLSLQGQSIVFEDGLTVDGDLVLGADADVVFHGAVSVTGNVIINAGGRVTFDSQFVTGGSVQLSAGSVRVAGSLLAAGQQVDIHSTQTTVVSAVGVIDVSGIGGGDAGSIRLWADAGVGVFGTLAAAGSATGGDGGLIEVSSAGALMLSGQIATDAPAGADGQLLIDPKSVTIGLVDDGYAQTDFDQFTDLPGTNVNLSVVNLLTWGDVTILANNDITINAAVNMGVGDSLTLQAGRSVLINANISTVNEALSITANDAAADPLNRDAGLANITMSAGTALNAGNATITLAISAGAVGTEGAATIDEITTSGAVNISSGGSIVESDSDAADDITAGTLTMTVRDSGALVGAEGNALEINAATLNVTTNDGHAVLADSAGGIELAAVDVGTADFLLTVDGGDITSSAGLGINVVAGLVNFTVTGTGGIGVGANGPLRTTLGIFNATTEDGSISITETDGLIVTTALAREILIVDGNPVSMTPFSNASGQVVLDSDGTVGTFDVSIVAGGDILVYAVTSPDALTLSSAGGTILDGNAASGNLLARTANVSANGDIGQSVDEVDTTVETLNATSTTGAAYFFEMDALTIGTVNVATDFKAGTNNGSITLGDITAGGTATLNAAAGSIVDNHGGTDITANEAILTGRDGVGTSANPIDTSVAQLTVSASTAAAKIYVVESDGLTSLDVTTNRGDASVTFTGGPLTFTASSKLLTASGAAITFENTGGDVVLDQVNAGAGDVFITASGTITDNVNDGVADIIGGAVTLRGTAIGESAGNGTIDTTADSIQATATAGGIYLNQSAGLSSFAASASGAGNDIVVITGGDTTLGSVVAPDDITLNAGGSVFDGNGATPNLTGDQVTITATGAIGTAGDAIDATISALDAVASGGGLFLANSGGLSVTQGVATGANLYINAAGNLTISTITAAGQTATLTSSAQILDGNGAAVNITAATAVLTGQKIGTGADAIDTAIGTLRASTTAGGIFIDQTGVLAIDYARALGDGSDVEITTDDDVALSEITAAGDDVVLAAGSEITDANLGAVNVTAKKLTISAPDGIGVSGPGGSLELNVNELDGDGGSGGADIVNAGNLALTDASFEGKGSATVKYQSDSITILDMADDLADLGLNGSVELVATTGSIVFIDLDDTIQTSGTGSISINAWTGAPVDLSEGNYRVAIVGNLTTAGGDIDVYADGSVVIGKLDAGTGTVTVLSAHGEIIDGNGATVNIVASTANLTATTPSERDAELTTMRAIADGTASRAEAAAKRTSSDSFASGAAITASARDAAYEVYVTAQNDTQDKQDAKDDADAVVEPLAEADLALTIVSQALDIANTIAGTIGAVAQAVPFTGDGGAATAAFVITICKNTTDVAELILSQVLDAAEGDAAEAATALAKAEAQEYAALQTWTLATATANAFQEAYSIADAAAIKAEIIRDTDAQISIWAIRAENQNNAIGTEDDSLQIDADTVNLDGGEGAIYLTGAGDLTIDDTDAAGDVVVEAPSGDIIVIGTITSPTFVWLNAANRILDGGGQVVAPDFLAEAGTYIGTAANNIEADVDNFAADGGAGGVFLNNADDLTITTLGGVAGVTGAADVSIAAAGSITLEQDITALGQTVTLDATAGGIVDDHAGSADVSADTLFASAAGGISLDTAVDNITATTSAAGAIELSDVDGVTLTNVQSANGAITIDAGGPVLVMAVTSVTDADANDISLTANGGITLGVINAGTNAGDVTLDTTSGVLNGPGGHVTADVLTVDADTDVDLETTVNSADISVSGIGHVNMDETDAVILTDVDTANGSITVTAGGTITATDVQSLLDTGGAGISLTATAGGIIVGTVNAGSANNDVTLDAATTITTAPGGRLTADALVADAANGITLTTTVNTADLTSSVGGGISVTELDAIELIDVDAANGAIAVTAGGTITATDVQSLTDADANDISLTATTGGIVVGTVNAGTTAGDVTLNAATAITTAPGGRATADVLTADAVSGITLVTTANSGDLSVSDAGAIDVTELNAITLTDVDTANGSITVAAGGAITATDVQSLTDNDANDISLTSTVGGIEVGLVSAGSTAGDITLSAAGAITELAPTDGAADLLADDLSAVAGTGIGQVASAIEITVNRLEANGGTGGVYLTDLADGLTVGGVTAGLAGVTASGGAIALTAMSPLTINEPVTNTGGGDITLTAAGTEGDDDLQINANVTTVGAGNINLLSADDVLQAVGATISAPGGTVAITADVPDDDPGVGSTVDLAGPITAATLTITTGSDNDTVNIANATNGGTDVNTAGGDDTVTVASGVTLGSGTIELGAGNDSLTLSTGADDVNGSAGDDDVMLKLGGSIGGTLAGGADYDSLTWDGDGVGGDDYVGAVTVNLQTGVATSVAAFNTLESFTSTDNAADTLIGANADRTWHIVGDNAGDIGGAGVLDFVGFGNLTGGTGDDDFVFGSVGSLSGDLDGAAGDDTLDYNTGIYGAAVTVELDLPTGGEATAIGGRFDSIENVVGYAAFASDNSLTGSDTGSVWTGTGPNAGNIDGVFFYTNFGTTIGGGGGEDYVFDDGALPDGPIDGGNGDNTLDLSDWTGTLVWHITGDNAGTVDTPLGSFDFLNMGTLVGGAGNDTFIFSDGCVITDGLTGGPGEDTIDFSDYTSQNVWTGTRPAGQIATAGGTFTYASVEHLIGGLVTTFRFEMPDLTGVFTRDTLPATIVQGADGRLSLLLVNEGNDRVRGRMNVDFYLSLDGTVGAGDILIGQAADYYVDLFPGRTTTCTVTAVVPDAAAPGVYNVLAFIDATNVFDEENELNNTVASGTVQIVAPGMDLSAAFTQMTLPATALPGDTGRVALQVTNNGNIDVTTPIRIELYLSTDGTVGAGDVLLGAVDDWTTNLGAGESRTFRTTVTIPDGTAADDYQVLAVVDVANVVAEFNELNNQANSAAGVQLDAPFVDLTAAPGVVNLPGTAVPGDHGSFRVVIVNIGNIPAVGDIDVQVYASIDGTLDGADILVAEVDGRSVNIDANGAAVVNIPVTLTSALLPATYNWLVSIDSGNAIAESNEGNNDLALAPTATELVWKFGNFDGRRHVRLHVNDAFGVPVTYSLTGNGVGSVLGGTALTETVIVSTNARSSVRVKTDGRIAQADNVTIREAMNTFSAPDLQINGRIVTDNPVRRFVYANQPTVTVAAIDAAAAETDAAPLDTGLIRITRTSAVNDLAVLFTLSGSAERDVDYTLSVGGVALAGNQAVIPHGADHVDILVTPLNNAIVDGLRTLKLKLANGAGYVLSGVSAERNTTVGIADND